MATNAQNSTPISDLTDVEKDVANAGPAVLSNRFFAVVGQWGVRLTFAEVGLTQQPAFRTAVVMTLDDGIALSEMLQKLIQEHQSKSSQETVS